jgi:Lrp/AsnC family leucine-responsive transcriptional regulator
MQLDKKDLQRVVDALAVHGAVTSSLVLSSPVRKFVTIQSV